MGAGWRNAGSALGVLLGLAGLVAVPALVERTLPADGPLPTGEPLDVGYGVWLRPPPRARLELGPSRPGAGEVAMLVDELSIRVSAVELRGPADGFVEHTRYKFGRDEDWLAGPAVEISTAAGERGERGALTPNDRDRAGGCYAIVTALAAAVVVVITPVAGCDEVPDEVWDSVRSLTFEPVDEW